MLRVLLSVCFVTTIICAPFKDGSPHSPHIRVKRTGEEISGGHIQAEEKVKKSHVGSMSEDVKHAQGDKAATVQSEITAAEDDTSNSDVLPNTKVNPELVLSKEDQMSSDEGKEISSDTKEEESLENLLGDLTEDEETDLEKLMSTSKESGDVSAETDDVSTNKALSRETLAHKGNKYKNYMYDLYYPFGYGRKRRAIKPRAATAEDMMGMGEPIESGRRIKRDLAMDELRTILQGRQALNDYYDYNDYSDDYEEAAKEQLAEEEFREMLADELAREKQAYQDYEDYPVSNDYNEVYEKPDKYLPNQIYPDYEYPDEDLTMQQKLALMDYLKQNELENEASKYPYDQYLPSKELDYPEVEETYEDFGPAPNMYKRQFMMSFVPGNKRSGQFYPAPDGWWSGIVDPMTEQKRNDMEYKRLLKLAEALNGPQEYDFGK